MDEDRIKGAAKQAEGALKTVAGKAIGDAKLEADGKAERPGAVEVGLGGFADFSITDRRRFAYTLPVPGARSESRRRRPRPPAPRAARSQIRMNLFAFGEPALLPVCPCTAAS